MSANENYAVLKSYNGKNRDYTSYKPQYLAGLFTLSNEKLGSHLYCGDPSQLEFIILVEGLPSKEYGSVSI